MIAVTFYKSRHGKKIAKRARQAMHQEEAEHKHFQGPSDWNLGLGSLESGRPPFQNFKLIAAHKRVSALSDLESGMFVERHWLPGSQCNPWRRT